MRKRVAFVAVLGTAVLYLPIGSGPAETSVADPVRTRGDELDSLMAAALQRFALKAVVYDGLIAGRLTLPEAVAECEGIEGQSPELADTRRRGLDAVVPGRTVRERLAR